jgi:serpin B
MLSVGSPLYVHGQTSDVRKLAQVSNQFGCDLYRKLATEPGNLFISPHSLHAALTMTLVGAGPQSSTATQMAQTLHLTKPSPVGVDGDLYWLAHPQSYALLLTGTSFMRGINCQSNEQSPDYELISVNALWGQKGHPFKADYLRAVRDTFSGDLRDVDFAHDPEVARETINRWVQEQTKDKIKDLVAPDNVSPDTRLVLTNAIVFESAWLHAFPEEATSDQPFTLADGQKVILPTMRQSQRFGYERRNMMEVIELPYQIGALSMLILLPTKPDGLPALEDTLSAEMLRQCRQNLRTERLDLSLPRIKFECRYDLKDQLMALGMTDAFDGGKADFSGIDGSRELAISFVAHQTLVDIDEQGTEAAAATAVGIARTSIEIEPEVVRVDRPFVFAVIHKSTDTVLFLGRFSPTPPPR